MRIEIPWPFVGRNFRYMCVYMCRGMHLCTPVRSGLFTCVDCCTWPTPRIFKLSGVKSLSGDGGTGYHTDYNVLMGAPTGSGKTIVSELTMHLGLVSTSCRCGRLWGGDGQDMRRECHPERSISQVSGWRDAWSR